MLNIEEQIKKLQRVQAKIDLYRKLSENVAAELSAVAEDKEHKKLEAAYPGLLAEFCSEMTKFCVFRIDELNKTGTVQAAPTPAPRQVSPQPTIEAPAPKASTPPPPNPDEEPTDPLRFLMKYRHFDSKRVEYASKDGPVHGTVRGLVTPFIKIETDTGFVLDVPPKELKVIG